MNRALDNVATAFIAVEHCYYERGSSRISREIERDSRRFHRADRLGELNRYAPISRDAAS